jgi:hypothetical protein
VTYNTGINVELFFAPSGTTPAVSAIANSSWPASLTYDPVAVWTDIMGDTLFQAVQGTGGAGTVAFFQSSASGGGVYNNSFEYAPGNLTGGTTYSMYEVGWYTGPSGEWQTINQAAAADTWVGWSQVFSYTAAPTGTGGPFPAPFRSILVGNFLVGGEVPEPSTMALAGLGSLSFLLFRRRK